MLKQQCSKGKHYMDCWEVIFNTYSKQMLTANEYGTSHSSHLLGQPELATNTKCSLNNEAWPLPW